MMGAVKELMQTAAHLLKRGGLWWGIAISLGLAIGSLALATAVIIAWSPDHFRLDVARASDRGGLLLRLPLLVAKNLMGLVLILLGLVMALPGIPGQGLLTVIIGITVLDFPGKRRIESRLMARPRIRRTVNRVRARFNRPPLELG
jgi:hypothetical protein